MARYIDAEKIDFRIPYYPDEEGCDALVSIKTVKRCIDMTPTEDVAKIVRCKDCKYANLVRSCNKYMCEKGCGTLKYSTDFCSYATRKEQPMKERIDEKNCKECLHFEACCKWTDFPKQVGFPVCGKYSKQSEGEWQKAPDKTHWCSECGHDATYTFDGTEICGIACPFCGAQMKGGAE